MVFISSSEPFFVSECNFDDIVFGSTFQLVILGFSVHSFEGDTLDFVLLFIVYFGNVGGAVLIYNNL